ncbi:MAG TPA: tyrosine--tRNA ligase [Thermoanaerobaculia bacterium]
MSNFFEDMQARGLVKDVSAPSQATWLKLEERLANSPITGYIGFDPTAPSLHVGSLLQVMTLVRLQRAGHRPLAVVGGGTGLIGDPSGKASERPMLDRENLEANLAGIRAQLERFLDFSGSSGAILVDNSEWLGDLNLIAFLRDIGKLFSVNQMIARDSVTQRLHDRDQGISFTEFSYALLQAYDFLHLYDRYGCELQLGGSDQWGNILDGVDLIRRMRGRPAWGMTAPLVSKADGTKFGKSEKGNVWLDPALTRPYSFFQFWINSDDADAGRYLRYFTFLSLEEIKAIEASAARHPERREAQRILAEQVTRYVHGQSVLYSVLHATTILFGGGDLRSLSESELRDAFADAPRTAIGAADLGTSRADVTSLLVRTELEPSRARARVAVTQKAISLNNEPVTTASRILGSADLLPGGFVVLRRGKRAVHVIEVKGQ